MIVKDKRFHLTVYITRQQLPKIMIVKNKRFHLTVYITRQQLPKIMITKNKRFRLTVYITRLWLPKIMNFKSKMYLPTALSSFFVDTSGKPQYSPSCIQKHSCQQRISEKHHEIFVISNKFSYLCSAFRTYSIRNSFGEMVEWSITTVLKTVVPRGTGGSNPSLSALGTLNRPTEKF